MTVTLYQPGLQPQELPTTGFTLDAGSGEVVQNQGRAAELLGCAPELVDVLASGRGYLVYSVFDCDGAANADATAMLAQVADVELDAGAESEVLRGPVLVVNLK